MDFSVMSYLCPSYQAPRRNQSRFRTPAVLQHHWRNLYGRDGTGALLGPITRVNDIATLACLPLHAFCKTPYQQPNWLPCWICHAFTWHMPCDQWRSGISTALLLQAMLTCFQGRQAHLVAVQSLVVLALLMCELHPHHHLLLLRQVFNVLLHASQQNGPQLCLQ